MQDVAAIGPLRRRGTGRAAAVPAARVLLVLAAAIAAFVGVRLATHHGQPGGFVVAGSHYVSPSTGLPVSPGSGYDGQFFYRLAIDPFTTQVSAHGITLDNPPYRQQRVGYPAVAWLVNRVPGTSTAVSLIAVNAAAVFALGWVGIGWCDWFARSRWWAAGLAATPPVVMGLARDLSEPLALAALLGGLLLWCRGRHGWAAAVLTVSVLTREAMLPVLAGMGCYWLYALVRRRRGAASRVGWLLVPGLSALAWQLYLQRVWGGRLPILHTQAAGTAEPFLSVVRSFTFGVSGIGFTHAGLLDLFWLGERVALVALLVAVLGTLPGNRLAVDVRVGWVVAALLAVSVQWHQDIEFVRIAMEAIAVGQLALLGHRGGLARPVLTGVGLWSAAVAVVYAIAL